MRDSVHFSCLFLLKNRIILIFVCVCLCFLQFGYPEDLSTRSVHVRIAVDEEFRKNESWRQEVKRLILETSRIFEKNFAIKLELQGIEAWYSQNSQFSMFALLKDLRQKVPKEDTDIILGLTSQYHLKNDLLGLSSYLDGFVLLRKIDSNFLMQQTLVHEFGHLFGAIDLNDKQSVMGDGAPVESFDDFSKHIIFTHKHRRFQSGSFPLPQQRFDEALALYRERKKLNLDETDVYVKLALLHLEKGEYDAVEDVCHQALRVEPNLPEVLNLLGISYRKRGQLDKAIDIYKRVNLIQPDITEVHFNLGIAYMKKGQTIQAEQEFKETIRLNPNYAKAYTNLSQLYIDTGRLDEAEKESRKALKIRPNVPEAHYNQGRVYLLNGHLKMAIVEFKKAIRLHPGYYKAYSNLASALLKKGQPEEALQACKESIAIKPDYAYGYFNQASAYLQLDNMELAKQSCLLSIEYNPLLPESHNLMGVLFKAEGDDLAGIAAFLKALELNPDYLEAHLNLGHTYFELNQIDEAATYYEHVVRIDPQNSKAYNNLAVICFFKENFNLSSHYVSKAEGLGLSVHPDFKKQLSTKLRK